MKNINKLKLPALLALAVSILTPTLATATAIQTGNDLFTLCKNVENIPHVSGKEIDDANECLYYVRGFRDGLTVALIMGSKDSQSSVCIDDEVILGQVVAVIVKYLRDHPESRNKVVPLLAYKALADGFPCKAAK